MNARPLLEEARRLHAAGLPLLPNDPATKYPTDYAGWEHRSFSLKVIEQCLAHGRVLGLRMGNGRETIDLDSKHWLGDPAELREGFETMVREAAPGLLERLMIASTQSDGRHYVYHCPGATDGNLQLAQRPPTDEERAAEPKKKAVILIETRGQGGQIMIAPTPGYRVLQGDYANLPTITAAERATLFACARAWTQIAPRTVNGPRRGGDSRPGDAYNANGGADEALALLEGAGWVDVRSRGTAVYLRRPGKKEGISATYGYVAPGVFYCFTSNGSPFEPETGYTPFAVYATLAHDGDYGAAAKALAERYGLPYYPEGEPVEHAGARCCPRHRTRPLQASKQPGWWYCSAALGDGAYCTYGARMPDYTPPPAKPAPDDQKTTATSEGPTAALAAALKQAGYHCALNTETDEITVNGELLSDVTRALLRAEVRDRQLGKVSILDDAITLQAHQNRVAPIRDGLAALQWDGKGHIARLAACLRDAGDQIHYADGSHRRAAGAYLLRWLLGAVGRVVNGDQNAMLVLDGAQGIGKSSLARWLGSVLPGTFCEETISPQDKDSLLRLTKALVWEAPEIDAVTRRHDTAALKHFLTRSTVQVRRAYGRHDITKPVLASFVATVNSNGGGFLPDATGNRRYLVLSLTGVDWSYQQLDPTQVWAEAVARYRQGERGHLTTEEAAYRDATNAERHQQGGLMDDWLRMYFGITGHADDLLTSGEIAEHLAHHRVTLGGNDRAAAMAIADALTRVGIGRAERRRAIARYGDARRAWAGIRLHVCPLCDPTSGDDPTMIQPRAKVGSSQQHAANTRYDPTDPTSSLKKIKRAGETSGVRRRAPDAPEDPLFSDISDEVGSQGAYSAVGSLDPTFSEVGSRLDQGWIAHPEVGSPAPPPPPPGQPPAQEDAARPAPPSRPSRYTRAVAAALVRQERYATARRLAGRDGAALEEVEGLIADAQRALWERHPAAD